jgi:hypothetical protein
MNNNTLSIEDRISLSVSDLRTHVGALVRRWRLRRIGSEVRQSFAAVDAALRVRPEGSAAAFFANLDLIDLLRLRAPAASPVIDPSLEAALALSRLLAGDSMNARRELGTLDEPDDTAFPAMLGP